MTYHRIDNGSEGRPNPPVESLPLQWPVLARLPWVGSAVEPMREQPAPAEPLDLYAGRQAEAASRPPLRIVGTPVPPMPTSANIAASASYESAPAAASPRTAQATRHYRIDAGDGRIVAAAIGRSAFPAAEPTSNSFAARVFQWHSALAPHAGVALTFFLALTAGLLYWRTLGPAAGTATFEPAAAPLAWSGEYTPPAAPEASAAPEANEWPSSPAYDVPEMSWPLSPRVTLDAAPLSAAVAETPDSDSLDALVRDLRLPTDNQAAEDAPAPAAEITPTPTAPTPATSPLAYPSTPFALIDPNAVQSEEVPAASTNPESPMPGEAPIEGASLPGSSR